MRADAARPFESAAPNFTPALLLVAFVAAVFLTSDRLNWIGAAVLASVIVPASLYWFSSNVSAALGALIAASAMPRYFLPVGGMKARPEHLVVGVLCVAAVLIYKRRQEPLPWIFGDILLLAYVALNMFSSAFMSVAPAQTLKWSLQQTLVVATYFLIRLLAGNENGLRLGVKIMLWVGMLEGFYAALCFYSGRIIKTDFGLEPGQYDNVAAVYGTQFEANLLGSYCAACMIMMVVMYFRSANRKYLWGIASTYLGLLVSFSRAALIAAAAALLGLVIYTAVARAANRATLVKVIAIVLLVTLIVGPTLAPLYLERFSTLDRSNLGADDNTRVRLLTLAMAISHILESPVFGNGTSSFQLLFDYKEIGYETEESAGWISNSEIRILHDTGAVGLMVFLWFAFYLIIRGIKVARRSRSPELTGLLLASVVYMISFQATEGTLLAFAWVHLGLIAAGIAVYSASDREVSVLRAARAQTLRFD